MLLPNFTRRRERFEPVTFAPAHDVFQPQVEVRMLKDVNGWVDRRRRVKWSLSAGQTYMVDEQTAVEFITKGYANGALPRKVSADEKAEIRSVMTSVGPGASDG